MAVKELIQQCIEANFRKKLRFYLPDALNKRLCLIFGWMLPHILLLHFYLVKREHAFLSLKRGGHELPDVSLQRGQRVSRLGLLPQLSSLCSLSPPCRS